MVPPAGNAIELVGDGAGRAMRSRRYRRPGRPEWLRRSPGPGGSRTPAPSAPGQPGLPGWPWWRSGFGGSAAKSRKVSTSWASMAGARTVRMRLMREDGRPLGHGPDVPGEAETGSDTPKTLGENRFRLWRYAISSGVKVQVAGYSRSPAPAPPQWQSRRHPGTLRKNTSK